MNEQDKAFQQWWNTVRANDYWSGAVVGSPLPELWDDAQAQLRIIFDAAVKSAIEQEREACIIAVEQEMRDEQDSHDEYYNLALNRAVIAIRNRGE